MTNQTPQELLKQVREAANGMADRLGAANINFAKDLFSILNGCTQLEAVFTQTSVDAREVAQNIYQNSCGISNDSYFDIDHASSIIQSALLSAKNEPPSALSVDAREVAYNYHVRDMQLAPENDYEKPKPYSFDEYHSFPDAKILVDIIQAALLAERDKATQELRSQLCAVLYPNGIKHPQKAEWEWMMKAIPEIANKARRDGLLEAAGVIEDWALKNAKEKAIYLVENFKRIAVEEIRALAAAGEMKNE